MGMILVNTVEENEALYLKPLGLRVYSTEELCWALCRYPLLFFEAFPESSLIRFLAENEGTERLAAELGTARADGRRVGELLPRIPEVTGYLSGKALAAFRAETIRIDALKPAQFQFEKAGILFSAHRYAAANAIYEKILSGEEAISLPLTAKILYNRGCALANLFFYEKASRCFEEAYGLTKDPEILKQIYFLSRRESVIEVRERILKALPFEIPASWDREYEEALEKAACSEELGRLEETFRKDPVQKQRILTGLVRGRKADYRLL